MTRGGVVFHSEIEEAAGRTERERNNFSKHLEEIEKEAAKCASVRDIRGEDGGKMKQVVVDGLPTDLFQEHFLPHVQVGQDASSYNRATISEQLHLNMLPKDEQVKARMSLLAKQLESLSPGDLKWDEFERAEMEKGDLNVGDFGLLDMVGNLPTVSVPLIYNSGIEDGEKQSFGLVQYVERLYDMAGGLVEEPEEQITLEKYHHLLSDKVANAIRQVLFSHPLELQAFQKLTLHAFGSGQNVILMDLNLHSSRKHFCHMA